MWQIGTTKGTGGDVLVLEEAAYCDEGFFYGTSMRHARGGRVTTIALTTSARRNYCTNPLHRERVAGGYLDADLRD